VSQARGASNTPADWYAAALAEYFRKRKIDDPVVRGQIDVLARRITMRAGLYANADVSVVFEAAERELGLVYQKA